MVLFDKNPFKFSGNGIDSRRPLFLAMAVD
jgi:hypothetical protein